MKLKFFISIFIGLFFVFLTHITEKNFLNDVEHDLFSASIISIENNSSYELSDIHRIRWIISAPFVYFNKKKNSAAQGALLFLFFLPLLLYTRNTHVFYLILTFPFFIFFGSYRTLLGSLSLLYFYFGLKEVASSLICQKFKSYMFLTIALVLSFLSSSLFAILAIASVAKMILDKKIHFVILAFILFGSVFYLDSYKHKLYFFGFVKRDQPTFTSKGDFEYSGNTEELKEPNSLKRIKIGVKNLLFGSTVVLSFSSRNYFRFTYYLGLFLLALLNILVFLSRKGTLNLDCFPILSLSALPFFFVGGLGFIACIFVIILESFNIFSNIFKRNPFSHIINSYNSQS